MVHDVYVKQDVYTFFLDGKDIEVRVSSKYVREIQEEDLLNIHKGNTGISIQRTVKKIHIFSTFEELFEFFAVARIAPGYSTQGAINLLRSIYSAEREKKGVYAFVLEEPSIL